MFIPFVSSSRRRSLERRKGGGGKGGGSSSSGSKTGSGSSSSGSKSGGSSSSGSTSQVSTPNVVTGRSGSTVTSYGVGGGKAITIPAGQPFAGRTAGGGSRAQVYGTSVYGSGYPGFASQRGVGGLGLPFYFWPVVWGGAGLGTAAYLHDSNEYGSPSNTSRPGGALYQASFKSNTTSTTLHLISDNSTVTSLLASVQTNCTSFDLGSTAGPAPYTGASTDPQPEQAIQYYRASSVALTLEGYNDTAALGGDSSAPPTPLPSGIDTTFLECVNSTIGAAVPLVDGAGMLGVPSVGVIALVWLVISAVQRL